MLMYVYSYTSVLSNCLTIIVSSLLCLFHPHRHSHSPDKLSHTLHLSTWRLILSLGQRSNFLNFIGKAHIRYMSSIQGNMLCLVVSNSRKFYTSLACHNTQENGALLFSKEIIGNSIGNSALCPAQEVLIMFIYFLNWTWYRELDVCPWISHSKAPHKLARWCQMFPVCLLLCLAWSVAASLTVCGVVDDHSSKWDQ